MTSIEARIRGMVQEHPVVLFMKGTRHAPQCGFSATVVEVLADYLDDYVTVDVLSDAAIREGIKHFSSWPTIPQLYVRGEFVGGSDIVREMAESGELARVLGAEKREVELPDVRLTAAAVAALRSFSETDEPPVVRLKSSADFHYALDFDSPGKHDLVLRGDGYSLVIDPPSARRLDGTVVDYLDRPGGGGFKIDNPNEPPKVQPLTPAQVAQRIADGAPLTLLDVRGPDERAIASLPGAIPLDEAGKALLEDLDRDAFVVVLCHHGVRSRAAAEHILRMGFRRVHNLEGGIDAWSLSVDPSVPRY